MTGAEGEPTIEIVRSAERFGRLAGAWGGLWTRADGSVFQSHAWISAWFGTLRPGSGQTLHVALAWREGALVGAMPLACRRRCGLRVLEWAAKDYSDYCDILLAPVPDRGEVALRLWEAVRRAGGYDVAYLSHIAPDAAAAGLLGHGLRRGRRAATSLRVRIASPSGAAWFESLPKKARQNDRRGRKVLADAGPTTFRLLAPSEPLGPILDRMVALKRDWLVRTGQTSPLVAGGAGILTALVGALARTGRLRVFVLEQDGRLVAASVNIAEHGRLMAFFATYDPSFERASPGMIVMVDYVRWAVDRGLAEIDFLCGAEEYKRRFSNAEVELASAVAARTLPGHAALLADRCARAAAAWRARYARSGPRVVGRSVPTATNPVIPASP